MPYLSRKRREAIVIGGDIEITVLGIRGRSFKLGITSPEGAQMLRREIRERMSREAKPDAED